MSQENLKELRRLIAQQKAAEDAKRFGPTDQIEPSELPNNEPGFEKPSIDEPRKDPSDLFAPMYGEDDNSRGLRDHVSGNYDLEAMLDVALQSGNEALIEETLDQYTDAVAQQFLAQNPDFKPSDSNLEKMIQELKHQAGIGYGGPLDADIDREIFALARVGYWTVEHLTAAKTKLLKMGALEVPEGTARSLNASELLHVQRTAVSDPVTAVCLYLSYASGKDPQTMTPQQLDQYAAQLLYDAKWRLVADDAALFAFANSPQTGYQQTPDRDAFIRNYAGSRPLSFPLLAAAWKECQRQEHIGALQRKRNQPVSIQELDLLDDAAVQRAYQETMKERAQRIHAADRGQEQPTDPVSALLQQKAEFENR